MKFEHNKKYFTIAIYGLMVLCGAILFYYLVNHSDRVSVLFRRIVGLLMPFITGFALAFILNPAMRWFEKLFAKIKKPKLNRMLAIALSVICFVVLIWLFFSVVTPQVILSLQKIVESLIQYSRIFAIWLQALLSDQDFSAIPQGVIDEATKQIGNIPNLLQSFISTIVPYIYNFVMSFFTGLINMVIGLIIAIYILASKERFAGQVKKSLYAIFPQSGADKFLNIMRLSNEVFSGFIMGRIVDAFIVGILCFIGTSIIGIEDALLISLIVGVTNVIPYFGPFLGAIPSILIIYIQDPIKALIFAAFILALQQVDGNIIAPRILSERTGLSGFWVIFSVTLGGGLFGVPGMFLGVPVFAVLYTLISIWICNRLEKRGLPVETREYLTKRQAELLK